MTGPLEIKKKIPQIFPKNPGLVVLPFQITVQLRERLYNIWMQKGRIGIFTQTDINQLTLFSNRNLSLT